MHKPETDATNGGGLLATLATTPPTQQTEKQKKEDVSIRRTVARIEQNSQNNHEAVLLNICPVVEIDHILQNHVEGTRKAKEGINNNKKN